MVLHPYCLLEQGLDFDIGCPLKFPFLVQFPLLDKGGYFASTGGHLGISINVKMADFAESKICNRNELFCTSSLLRMRPHQTVCLV